MEFCHLPIQDLIVIKPDVFGDNRGWFSETYSYQKYKENGIECVFVQDNQSFSAFKNVFRGIHFQKEPFAQSKLVRCIRGSILDIAVDLRKGSPTYLQWETVELSSHNMYQLFIPKGFGHGFLTLEDNCEVCYKVDAAYDKASDRSILATDPQIKLDLGVDFASLIRSQKDINAPLLSNSDCDFYYKK